MTGVQVPISLSRNLSQWLALQTLVGLTMFSAIVYFVISDHLYLRQMDTLSEKKSLVYHLVAEARQSGEIEVLRHKLEDFLAGHHELALVIKDPSQQILFQSSDDKPDSDYEHISEFKVLSPDSSKNLATAIIKHDGHTDAALLRRLAYTLILVSLIGALVVSLGAYWLVRRGLKPVNDLARQTSALNATSLPSELDGSAQPRELHPLVKQFNKLLERLSESYQRLEHFNADVAHELNTPLTTLITSTELALRTPQNQDVLREILGSNLEEFHRMSGIVNDMLFLSRAERGGRARCETVESLALVAEEVVEFHEAELLDASLITRIDGDATGEFDVPLIKRAMSNLLSNAICYGDRSTQINIEIQQLAENHISVAVINSGVDIPEKKISKIFDRFYRLDSSRNQGERHHGLGLSIVAGIAKMHGGLPFAESFDRKTRIGINLPKFDQTL